MGSIQKETTVVLGGPIESKNRGTIVRIFFVIVFLRSYIFWNIHGLIKGDIRRGLLELIFVVVIFERDVLVIALVSIMVGILPRQ
jgi:hypothetical protein